MPFGLRLLGAIADATTQSHLAMTTPECPSGGRAKRAPHNPRKALKEQTEMTREYVEWVADNMMREAYDLDGPKHPDYMERLCARADWEDR